MPSWHPRGHGLFHSPGTACHATPWGHRTDLRMLLLEPRVSCCSWSIRDSLVLCLFLRWGQGREGSKLRLHRSIFFLFLFRGRLCYVSFSMISVPRMRFFDMSCYLGSILGDLNPSGLLWVWFWILTVVNWTTAQTEDSVLSSLAGYFSVMMTDFAHI